MYVCVIVCVCVCVYVCEGVCVRVVMLGWAQCGGSLWIMSECSSVVQDIAL